MRLNVQIFFSLKDLIRLKQLQLKHQANQKIADMLKEETNKTISLVLNELSLSMKNKFERSDA